MDPAGCQSPICQLNRTRRDTEITHEPHLAVQLRSRSFATLQASGQTKAMPEKSKDGEDPKPEAHMNKETIINTI